MKYQRSNTSVFNIGYHLIWCPKYRRKVLVNEIEKRLKNLLKEKAKQIDVFIEKMEIMPDHVHLFVGLKPAMRISDLVRDVKNNTTNFINDNKYILGKFSWQDGYGAFSYAQSQIEVVFNYIKNQQQHHKKQTFQEEYLEFLDKFEIEYDEKYLFKWIEKIN